MTRVGLLVALPGEKNTLTNARIKPGRFLHLNSSTLVYLSGIGRKNATAGAVGLYRQGCDLLISWGCAAAIQTQLKPGDLLIPGRLLSASGTSWDIDNPWRRGLVQRLAQDPPITTEMITESPEVVATAEEKAALFQATGAAALDMESAAIAEFAAKHEIPMIAIRAIADPATMALPNAVKLAVDENGNVRLPSLLWELARHPLSVPAVIRLGYYFHAAQRRLRRTASKLEYNFCALNQPA